MLTFLVFSRVISGVHFITYKITILHEEVTIHVLYVVISRLHDESIVKLKT